MPIHYIPKPIKATITNPAYNCNVIYQNTRLRPIIVFSGVRIVFTDVLNPCYLRIYTGPTSPPTIWRGDVGYYANAGIGPTQLETQACFIVPPGHFYRLTTVTGGVNSIWDTRWTVIEL